MLLFQRVIYLRKRSYFSLRKPRTRTFYTDAAQHAKFMDKYYLACKSKHPCGIILNFVFFRGGLCVVGE
ncbi:MAG: hypothetical protein CSA04_04450 [Bacteroidetes bacterium]|nr:MAG: hypothetical protein CSA04_04450 [Bacteroidota bacterium]